MTSCAGLGTKDSFEEVDASFPDPNFPGLPVTRDDETFELSHVVFKDECAKTQQDGCDACKANQRISVDECWWTCEDADSAALFKRCASICSDLGRSDRCDYACKNIDADRCTARKYTFTVSGKRDADVEAACKRAVEKDDQCGVVTVNPTCDVAARVERKEAVRAYGCVAETECEQSLEACFDLGTSDFADDVVSACEQEPLREELVSWLETIGAWLRPAALEDVAICERLCGTGDYSACVDKWARAVLGE